MEVLVKVVLTASFLASCIDASDAERCKTPQYAELGSRATIHCYFTESFYGVYWYNSTEVLTDEPILLLQGSAKSGKGYDSGKFDIYLNGSLIINHVTRSQDEDFGVVKLNSPSADPVSFFIHVIVTVKPSIPFPRIDRCENDSRVCVTQLHPDTQLTCVVKGVRPAVNLQWLRRTYRSDVNISYESTTVSHDDFLYNSVSSTMETLSNSPVIELLACRAITPPELLEKQESLILVQNSDVDLSGGSIEVFVERYSRMELNCTKVPAGFLVWKKLEENMQFFEDILIAVFLQENFVKVNSENFQLGNGGSLVSPNVGVENEGRYACVFGNGFVDGVTLFDVVVYVKPNSVYPVIIGCVTDRYCELAVERKGTLTCIVEGIRPEVDLEWKILYSAKITFSNQQTKVKSNEKTFTLSTTTDYSVHAVSESKRLTIECRIAGKYGHLFDTSAKADLFFSTMSTTDPNNEVTSKKRPVWIIGIASSVLILIIVLVAGVTYYMKVKRRTNNKSMKMDSEEKIPMFPDNLIDQQFIEKKAMFVKSLKGKYEDLYDAIQPIPYIRDRLYCVNKVYVEGGIDILLNDKGSDKKRTWERIESYHSILSDSRIKSTRKIVEGDAGYGKTTLTLQFAYDWCKRVDRSPLVDVDVLILLRLRQLSGVMSVYRAIKQFILPRDCPLSEEDIETIIQSLPAESVLVILDGFDEYSDQYSHQDLKEDTDIMHIIRREMFQQIPVILTTRSSSIPHDFAAKTRHIRLTGFDELARDTYIRKAVVGADAEAAMRIKQRLQDNPVLADVCQVPLFFVMFAHMTHERDEFTQFQSVTSFFRYMVGCFHGHLHKKDKTKSLNYKSFEQEHRILDQEALDSLSGESKRNVWRRETLIKLLGQEFYEHYVRVGILLEEEVLDFAEEDGSNSSYFKPYRRDVRFYHKLFCEWYASHALSEIAAKSFSPSLKKVLSRIDPYELHYLYRFACGLNKKAAENILHYLSGVESSEQFETLCILEQKGKVENIKNRVEKLCSETIIVSDEDSQLKQRSTIELLEIASSNAIKISCVSVENCIKSVNLKTWNLNLKSGMSLSNLSSVQEMNVTEIGRQLTEQEATDIISFCFQCLELKVLRFDCCMLPQYIKVPRAKSDINQADIKVIWSCTESWLQLNLASGCWESQIEGESSPITDAEYQSEAARFRREYSELN